MYVVLLINLILVACLFFNSKPDGFADTDWNAALNIDTPMPISSGNRSVMSNAQSEEEWGHSKFQWEEQDDQYVATVELDNMDYKTVKITVNDGTLTVSAKKHIDADDVMEINSQRIERKETGERDLKQEIQVPSDGDLSRMEHHFVDGNVQIIIPKKRLKSII